MFQRELDHCIVFESVTVPCLQHVICFDWMMNDKPLEIKWIEINLGSFWIYHCLFVFCLLKNENLKEKKQKKYRTKADLWEKKKNKITKQKCWPKVNKEEQKKTRKDLFINTKEKTSNCETNKINNWKIDTNWLFFDNKLKISINL